MSYSKRITILYGVRLPRLSIEQWEEKLNDFLSTDFGLNSGIVGNCAEYNGIDRKEVDSELLHEYLADWRDLREISEQTFDMGVIGQLVYALFPLSTPAPYLINWVI